MRRNLTKSEGGKASGVTSDHKKQRHTANLERIRKTLNKKASKNGVAGRRTTQKDSMK